MVGPARRAVDRAFRHLDGGRRHGFRGSDAVVDADAATRQRRNPPGRGRATPAGAVIDGPDPRTTAGLGGSAWARAGHPARWAPPESTAHGRSSQSRHRSGTGATNSEDRRRGRRIGGERPRRGGWPSSRGLSAPPRVLAPPVGSAGGAPHRRAAGPLREVTRSTGGHGLPVGDTGGPPLRRHEDDREELRRQDAPSFQLPVRRFSGNRTTAYRMKKIINRSP